MMFFVGSWIIGAASRWLDGGGGKFPSSWLGLGLTAALILAVRWRVTGEWDWWLVWTGAVATLSLTMGRTDWEEYRVMVPRFSLPALVAAAPLLWADPVSIGAWAYVAGCTIAGALYPLLMGWNPPWSYRWLFDGPESIARLPAGGFILGGLAWV